MRHIVSIILQASRRARAAASAWLENVLRLIRRFTGQLGARAIATESDGPASKDQPTVTDTVGIAQAIHALYQGFLGRGPAEWEVRLWESRVSDGLDFYQLVNEVANSSEANKYRAFLSEYSDGEFIQMLYEIFLDTGAIGSEIRYWQDALVNEDTDRMSLVRRFTQEASKAREKPERVNGQPPSSFRILGSPENVTIDDWNARANTVVCSAPSDEGVERKEHTRFHVSKQHTLVTAIASLYKGGAYIEKFLDNICSQSSFSRDCELIIIDANSPENESAVIERYTRRYKNIVYRRIQDRIGIYEAWNIGVELSRGEYLTNTNVDDIRRHDSLELQASTLDALSFVDVVYQDFYCTLDPNLNFDEVAAFGYKSELPVITPYNLICFNSPHNAPMWRKSLHDELGGFDASFTSAGDCEFWIRCLVADKSFYKLNDPHVVYYQNPEGVSTRPNTRGVEEMKCIRKKYTRQLISPNVVCERVKFRQQLGLLPDAAGYDKGDSRYDDVQTALRKLANQSESKV